MSMTLLYFAKSFIDERVGANVFSVAFIELWKIEGAHDICALDEPGLSSCLSSIFCVADLYNPEITRAEYEVNEEELRVKVSEFIRNMER